MKRYLIGSRIFCVAIIGVSLLIELAVSFPSSAQEIDLSQEVSSLDVDAAQDHLRLGEDFFLTHELDMAVDEFREAAGQRPGFAHAYHNLGVTLAKTGDLTGAIAAWSEAERIDPQAVSLRYHLSALVSYNYGVSLVRDGHLHEAMAQWEGALRVQPNFSEAHYALGLAYLVTGHPPSALTHFRETLRWAPDWPLVLEALGLAHYKSHQYGLAEQAWHQALALKPDQPKVHANLGLLQLQKGNYQQAIEHSRAALALQGDLVAAHFNLGVALFAKGEEQASVEALQAALDLDAYLTSARLLLGVVWSRMGHWASATHSWREALRRDPFGRDAIWLHENLGIALVSMGQQKEAAREFRWVVEQRPEGAQGWFQLAMALMATRQWEEAVTALKTATQLEPEWAHLYFALGNVYVEQGDLAQAITAFGQAVTIAPNFVDALFHLGIVQRAQNRVGDAFEPIRRAAEGGSREAQGLLASMYANGSGVDRNVPLAMLWWSRSSRESIPDTVTRTAKNRLSQLRRGLHRQQFVSTERQDVLTGFGLIRQDLHNQAPMSGEPISFIDGTFPWDRVPSKRGFLRWMIERAFALDKAAQKTLYTWYVEGVVGQFPPKRPQIQGYWLQVAKEGDGLGCEVILKTMDKAHFQSVRRACRVVDTE